MEKVPSIINSFSREGVIHQLKELKNPKGIQSLKIFPISSKPPSKFHSEELDAIQKLEHIQSFMEEMQKQGKHPGDV